MPLATIDDLKQYLGSEFRDADDVLLTRLVTAATDVVENYCGRTFASTVYSNEMYTGTGTKILQLRHWPIISVSSLTEAGSPLTTGTDPYGSPSCDVIIDSETGRLIRPWFPWLGYWNYYKITYTAGYATIPASLVQATVDVAALMLRAKEHVGMASKNIGQQTVAYISALPEHSQRALDGYADLSLGRSV